MSLSKYNICAGIVTYNPDIERFKKVLCAISPQVEKIYIFDNGSKNLSEIIDCKRIACNIMVYSAKNNMGIAYALNSLCKTAIKNEYDWILTLDHDTICSENMIKSFMELTKISNAGIICPRVHYVNYLRKEKGNVMERYSEVTACMTSGSFMRLSAFKKTSGFDNWMFIDYVDNDICMKLKLAGYRILRDNHVFMDHQLGHNSKRKWLGITINDFNYSSLRIYHIIRNEIYFLKKYRKHTDVIKQILIIIQQCLCYCILYHSDEEKMKALKSGIVDGLKIKMHRR